MANWTAKVASVADFIFWGFRITSGSDRSQEIQRCFFLGRKTMTTLESVFKRREITLQTKVHIIKAMVFPVVTYGCGSWTIKKVEHWRTDAFELWCWRRLLRVPWTARRSSQSILKESILNIHWKGWCWNWSSNSLATWCKKPTHWKKPWSWEILRAGEGDETIGWHHQLNRKEFKNANSGR